MSLFLSSGLYAENVSLTADGKVPGKPFEEMQAQINALNSRIAALETDTSTNTDDISQIAANVNQNASRILDNKLGIVDNREYLDGIDSESTYLAKCFEVKELALETFAQLHDELAVLPDGGIKEITWVYYSLDDNDEVTATEQTESLDADKLREVIREVETRSECVRNNRQIASGLFEHFDGINTQNIRSIARVMRAMKNMESGISRNNL
jgi:hypothetical protein